jgi:hypothetical protein
MEVSGQLHAPAALFPRKKVPGTHWIGGWVGPRTGLYEVVKRKIPIPRRESNPDHPIVQPVASRYTDWAVPALVLSTVSSLISVYPIPLSCVCYIMLVTKGNLVMIFDLYFWQPPIQWIPRGGGALPLGIKRPVCEPDHAPSSSGKVKNACSYASAPPVRPHSVVLN